MRILGLGFDSFKSHIIDAETSIDFDLKISLDQNISEKPQLTKVDRDKKCSNCYDTRFSNRHILKKNQTLYKTIY